MATVYKVRQGEQIRDVEGFAALVQMAQEGRLAPDDAVFVPASNRWHYARSIRQLREFFPAVEDPPPPPGKVREMPREQTNPQHDPSERTVAEDGSGNGGDVVPLRRGRWTPDGKGVEVPVFNYEMDLDPPPAVKPLRFLVLVGFALAIGGSVYLYHTSYAEYVERQAALLEAKMGASSGPVTDLPPPTETRPPQVEETPDRAAAPTAVGFATLLPAPATPMPTPAPAGLPAFDSGTASSRVMSAKLTPVARVDQLGNAIRSDLVKLAVPVRSVQVLAGKSKTKGPVPFEMVVEYSLSDEGNASLYARHYWMILAMTGRRANETRLNLRSVTVKSMRGTKVSSSAQVTADVVKGVAAGSQSPDAVLVNFSELTRR